jgi:hypothetical protein
VSVVFPSVAPTNLPSRIGLFLEAVPSQAFSELPDKVGIGVVRKGRTQVTGSRLGTEKIAR